MMFLSTIISILSIYIKRNLNVLPIFANTHHFCTFLLFYKFNGGQCTHQWPHGVKAKTLHYSDANLSHLKCRYIFKSLDVLPICLEFGVTGPFWLWGCCCSKWVILKTSPWACFGYFFDYCSTVYRLNSF